MTARRALHVAYRAAVQAVTVAANQLAGTGLLVAAGVFALAAYGFAQQLA